MFGCNGVWCASGRFQGGAYGDFNPNGSLGLSHLRALAERIDLHPNKLSWVLNECLGKNINEYINELRLGLFQQLALDPAHSHLSILGLAYESGFTYKTVFNNYFKKKTGTTPKKWLKGQS